MKTTLGLQLSSKRGPLQSHRVGTAGRKFCICLSQLQKFPCLSAQEVGAAAAHLREFLLWSPWNGFCSNAVWQNDVISDNSPLVAILWVTWLQTAAVLLLQARALRLYHPEREEKRGESNNFKRERKRASRFPLVHWSLFLFHFTLAYSPGGQQMLSV